SRTVRPPAPSGPGPQRGELSAQPAGGRVRRGGGGERGGAALALGVWHLQRPVQRVGGLGAVVRVDQQRVRGQVHPVPDRVPEQHVGQGAGGQRPGIVVLHLQDQRLPVGGAEFLPDLA